MRRKLVYRYYCDYCKKAGCSGWHMKNHELHCTMNPNRDCRVCDLIGAAQVPISDLIAVLPDPTLLLQYDTGPDGEDQGQHWEDWGVDAAIEKLREMTEHCPACIMAALRQAGIPVPLASTFRFKKEMEDVWSDINARNGDL